jgi:hypothetical protein
VQAHRLDNSVSAHDRGNGLKGVRFGEVDTFGKLIWNGLPSGGLTSPKYFRNWGYVVAPGELFGVGKFVRYRASIPPPRKSIAYLFVGPNLMSRQLAKNPWPNRDPT